MKKRGGLESRRGGKEISKSLHLKEDERKRPYMGHAKLLGEKQDSAEGAGSLGGISQG